MKMSAWGWRGGAVEKVRKMENARAAQMKLGGGFHQHFRAACKGQVEN